MSPTTSASALPLPANRPQAEPVLQRKQPREAWASWAEFAADDLDLSEIHGGNGMQTRAQRSGGDPALLDPMCVGQNCYAKVVFRIDGFTMSGMHIDQSAIAIQPSTSASVSTGVASETQREKHRYMLCGIRLLASLGGYRRRRCYYRARGESQRAEAVFVDVTC